MTSCSCPDLGQRFAYKYWKSPGLGCNVHIIHRGKIKVYYKSREDAILDGYWDFTSDDVNKKGVVFPFIGLRGDAKELYWAVKRGDTLAHLWTMGKPSPKPLVWIMQADPTQVPELKTAKVVIWACGYESKSVTSIEDMDGRKV